MTKTLKTAFGAMFALLLVGQVGCGPSGPKTYPVSGKIEIPGGNVSVLAGSHIEAVLDGDPTVRASGEIQTDGSFTLETLQAGVIRTGAQAGSYKARIILTDDDGPTRKRAASSIDPSVLKFESSGLEIQVPTNGNSTLSIPKRR